MKAWTARNLVPLISILALIGAGLYSIFAPVPAPAALTAAEGKYTSVEGVVGRDPDKRDTSTFLTIDVGSVNGVPSDGRVLMLASKYADVAYGDRVRAEGKLEVPSSFDTDTGRTFDYRHYLLAQGITHEMRFGKLTVLAHKEGNPVFAVLFSVKHFLTAGIERALPEPESALAGGLLLGDKRSLGDKITESFRRAGVVHIIVLSGYNVSVIISAVLYVALRFLSKRFALAFAALAVIAFAIMTGASETTVRAGAMALVALFAKATNRPADGVRILLMTAAGMAVWNPYLVLYDLSYQLSVLATLGLVLFSDPIAKRIPYVPDTLALREIVATTIATQLTVLPLLIFSIGQISLVSLFTNILVLPAIPLAMLASFVAGLAALGSYVLAFPATALAYATLHYIISVSVWAGNLPFSAVQVPLEVSSLALSVLAFLYAGVFFLWVLKRKALG